MDVVNLILKYIIPDIELSDILETIWEISPLAGTIISGIILIVCLTLFGAFAYGFYSYYG